MPSSAQLALLLVAGVSLASAQQVQLINYDALPSCAKGCTTLKTAQDGCIPPQAAVTTQQTYVSCFCQSAFLVNLKTTAQGLCDAACPSTSDQNAIKDWYNKYCSSGGTQGAAGASNAEPSATKASPAVPSVTQKTNDQSNNSKNNNQDVVGDQNESGYTGSWLSAHLRWIVMLVVIFASLMLLTLLGIWLKRRARERHDARKANVAAPEAAFSAPLPPSAPAMASVATKHQPDDSGTMTSTIDFGSTSTLYGPGLNNSVGNIAQSFLARGRSRSSPLGQFPIQPVPSPHNVWGPHQHQAATRGYEYPTYQNGSLGTGSHRIDRHIPSPADNSSSTGSTAASSMGSTPNSSLPHIAGVPVGHGPSPMGNGTPRKTGSHGELVHRATPAPLIASAGRYYPSTPDSAASVSDRDRTDPSVGSRPKPEVPRLDTAVGSSGSVRRAPQQVHSPETPPSSNAPSRKTTSPCQTQAGAIPTPPSTGIPPPTTPIATTVAAPRPSAADDGYGQTLSRTPSQHYGAAASFHNAGYATGGQVISASGSRKVSANSKGREARNSALGQTMGWTSSRENLSSRGVTRGGALIAEDEEKEGRSGADGDAPDAVAGAANQTAATYDFSDTSYNVGGRGRDDVGSKVSSPLSADNAREKLRKKLSCQGSGIFGDGDDGRGERGGT